MFYDVGKPVKRQRCLIDLGTGNTRYSGTHGNEKAYELARIGSSTVFTGAEPAVARYAGLIKKLVKDKTIENHQERWEALTNCRQSKEFLVGCNANNTKFF